MSLELLRATVAWTCSERSLDDPVGFAGDRLVTVGT